MRGLARLVLVVIVPGGAPGERAGDRMMVRVMAGDATHQRAPETAFSRGRRGRNQSARHGERKSNS